MSTKQQTGKKFVQRQNEGRKQVRDLGSAPGWAIWNVSTCPNYANNLFYREKLSTRIQRFGIHKEVIIFPLSDEKEKRKTFQEINEN